MDKKNIGCLRYGSERGFLVLNGVRKYLKDVKPANYVEPSKAECAAGKDKCKDYDLSGYNGMFKSAAEIVKTYKGAKLVKTKNEKNDIIKVDMSTPEGKQLQTDLNECLGSILDQDRFATKLVNGKQLTDYNDKTYTKCARFDKLVRTCYAGAVGAGSVKSSLWRMDKKNSNGSQYRGQCWNYWKAMQWMEAQWANSKAPKASVKAKVTVKKAAKKAPKKKAAKKAPKKKAALKVKGKVALKAHVKKRRLSTFKDMLITRENSYEVANGNGVDYDSYLRVFPSTVDKRSGKKMSYQFYFNSYLSRAPQGYSGCQAEKRYSTACDLISNSRVMTNMNYKDMTMVAIKPELCPPCPPPVPEKPCKVCNCQKLTDFEVEALQKVTGLVVKEKKQVFTLKGVRCDLKGLDKLKKHVLADGVAPAAKDTLKHAAKTEGEGASLSNSEDSKAKFAKLIAPLMMLAVFIVN
jgi:hypothetical protein